MPANGRLPDSMLARIPGSGPYGGPRLRKDCARLYIALHVVAMARWGISMALHEGSVGQSYRAFFRQVLAKATYGRDAATPGSSNHGLGINVDLENLRQRWVIDQIGVMYGFSKRWSDACVPLQTQILTRRGWVTYDEVREDDETVGYDAEDGITKWTPILGVYESEQEVYRHEHGSLALEATANHRWLKTRKKCAIPEGEYAQLGLLSDSGPRRRVLLAAEHEGGPGLPVTPEEVALIAWGLTDGTIYRSTTSARAAVRLYQTKSVGVTAVEGLLEHFPHTRHHSYDGGGQHAWYVGRGVFSEILHRSRLDELGVVRFVLEMSRAQRRAFLDAVGMAEGAQGSTGDRRIAQQAGPRREAFAIAAALTGNLVTLRPRTVNLRRPAVDAKNLVPVSLGNLPVWCPRTALGSWTAEQDGQVFLTGNSWEWWHITCRPERATVELRRAFKALRHGSRSARVKWLQRRLRAKGFKSVTAPGRKGYGFFGDTTRSAVRRFQKAHNLKADGVVGRKTWKELAR